jgi:hypothetical protein
MKLRRIYSATVILFEAPIITQLAILNYGNVSLRIQKVRLFP